MKKLLMVLGIILPISAMCLDTNDSTTALSTSNCYVGAEVGQSFTGFKLGSKLVRSKHASPFVNAYVGFKLSDNVGMELGGHTAITNKPSSRLKYGLTKLRGLHASILYYIPVVDGLNVIPGLGVSWSQIHAHKPSHYDFRKERFIPRVSMGIQYTIIDGLNARGTVTWHHIRAPYSSKMKAHDNFSIGLGLNYAIDML